MSGGWRWVFGAVVVLTVGALGGVLGSVAMASNAYKSKQEFEERREQTLQVTGSARKRIRSDLAVWNVHVTGVHKDLAEAYKVLRGSCDRIEKFLEANKFLPDEISADSISTGTQYKYENIGTREKPERVQTLEVEQYTLRRTYTIRTSRVDAVAKPAAAITELIQDGVQVSSLSPNYYYSKIADLKVEMLGEASKDARSRADQIVTNAGSSIAGIRQARMGVMQITQPNSTEVSDSGIHDTSTIEKDVTAVVTLTLGLR